LLNEIVGAFSSIQIPWYLHKAKIFFITKYKLFCQVINISTYSCLCSCIWRKADSISKWYFT